jgi:S1-C subfamily serine protease
LSAQSSEILKLLSIAIEEVVEKGALSVVSVGSGGRVGSGIVWDKDGHIVTAHHVIRGLDAIEIGTSEGRKLKAKVVGHDSYSDLALLQVKENNITSIDIGDSEKLKVGQFVLALANPFSIKASVTSGIITAVNRTMKGWWRLVIENAIVTDARLNPGYSGGPLLDASGKLIGLNIAYISNRGIAIPITSVKKKVERMLQGPIKKAYLGIITNTVTLPKEVAAESQINQDEAIMILSVEPNSAAKKAGLAFGDAIIKFNEQPVTDVFDLEGFLNEEVIGKSVKLQILRGEKKIEITVTPGEAIRG